MKRNQQLTTKRLSPGNYEVIDKATKTPLGRYGGRDGDKWAQTMTGEMITEGTSVSVAVLRSLIVTHSKNHVAEPLAPAGSTPR
jgi:hypothetical protein